MSVPRVFLRQIILWSAGRPRPADAETAAHYFVNQFTRTRFFCGSTTILSVAGQRFR